MHICICVYVYLHTFMYYILQYIFYIFICSVWDVEFENSSLENMIWNADKHKRLRSVLQGFGALGQTFPDIFPSFTPLILTTIPHGCHRDRGTRDREWMALPSSHSSTASWSKHKPSSLYWMPWRVTFRSVTCIMNSARIVCLYCMPWILLGTEKSKTSKSNFQEVNGTMEATHKCHLVMEGSRRSVAVLEDHGKGGSQRVQVASRSWKRKEFWFSRESLQKAKLWQRLDLGTSYLLFGTSYLLDKKVMLF